jgi:uncharacterized membrane protein
LPQAGARWRVDLAAAARPALTARRCGDAAIALYLAALVLGAIGGRRPKQARQLATRPASEDAPTSAQLRALLNDPLSLAANYTSAAAVLAILVLMVFKP